MSDFKCAICKFFRRSHLDAKSGTCRRFPPVNEAGAFPRVEEDDWCGEHSALQGYWPEYEQPNPDRPTRFVRFLP